MSEHTPCAKCGTILHTGEARITMSFSLAELEALVFSTADRGVVRRFICAIGILDGDAERRITGELNAVPSDPRFEEHAFKCRDGDETPTDCEICGEGRQMYLHTDRERTYDEEMCP